MFVCLFVSRSTQKLLDGFTQNVQGGCGMGEEGTHSILVVDPDQGTNPALFFTFFYIARQAVSISVNNLRILMKKSGVFQGTNCTHRNECVVLAATLFTPETPKVFGGLQHFTHPSISIVVRRWWVDVRVNYPFNTMRPGRESLQKLSHSEICVYTYTSSGESTEDLQSAEALSDIRIHRFNSCLRMSEWSPEFSACCSQRVCKSLELFGCSQRLYLNAGNRRACCSNRPAPSHCSVMNDASSHLTHSSLGQCVYVCVFPGHVVAAQ